MNGFVLVNKGTENVASCELIELIKTKPDVKETIIKFPIKSNLDLIFKEHVQYMSIDLIQGLANIFDSSKLKKNEKNRKKWKKLDVYLILLLEKESNEFNSHSLYIATRRIS